MQEKILRDCIVKWSQIWKRKHSIYKGSLVSFLYIFLSKIALIRNSVSEYEHFKPEVTDVPCFNH